jgi:hypothetical protein
MLHERVERVVCWRDIIRQALLKEPGIMHELQTRAWTEGLLLSPLSNLVLTGDTSPVCMACMTLP